MIFELRPLPRVAILFVAQLVLSACQDSLQCTSTGVVERLNVKLDREIKENVRFLAPHEPDLSRFDVSDIAPAGTDDGALACTAKLHVVLDASRAFAQAHGFSPPSQPRDLERTVRFTAHRGGLDTFVEVVKVDASLSTSSAVHTGGPSR